MKRKRASTASPAVAGIRISHADKTLWPASKKSSEITKLDLAHYYAAIASRMLPHVAGRPLSLVRAPDGINGEKFYQRHFLIGSSIEFGQIKVRGESKPFLCISAPEQIVALAQAGVLEIHPWGSKKGEPDTPARIVFDLDPAPDVKFEHVMEGAKELRERLLRCGLEPFLKTTGGKGLHVTVAIKGTPRHRPSWEDAKNFAQLVSKLVERDSPGKYTTTLSKQARGGKIFLDYLRNDRFATAVAPWSPRAREGAPVSMPLPWSKLRAGLDPMNYTIGTQKTWLKAVDPWKDLDTSARPLEAAIRKLTS